MPEEDLPEEILYEWGHLAEDLPIHKVKEILCDRYPNHVNTPDVESEITTRASQDHS
jgi:hypothetical protein